VIRSETEVLRDGRRQRLDARPLVPSDSLPVAKAIHADPPPS
jgi:hypothetical protein